MPESALTAELAAALAEHAARHQVPGASLALVRDGDAAVAAWGVRDVRSGAPVSSDTLFDAGSLTKTMGATLALRLARDRVLDLEAPIAALVPELEGARWAREASLDDVLASRSGIPLSAATEFDAAFDGSDALRRLAQALADGASTRSFWSYSNAAWAVLGRAVEEATGEVWEVALREHVLQPLGLASTVFAPEGAGGAAVGHEVGPGGAVPLEPDRRRAYATAGLTLRSTAGDLARFARAHLEDPDLAALRSEGQGSAIHGWFDAWCRGLARFDWSGGSAWGWSGLTTGQRALMTILPEQRGALVALANATTGRALFRSLERDLIERHFGVRPTPLRLEPPPVSPVDPDAYVGTYAWPDRSYQVVRSGPGLELVRGDRARPLRAIDERVFLLDASDPDVPTVTFDAFDAQGRPGVLYVMLWGFPRRA